MRAPPTHAPRRRTPPPTRPAPLWARLCSAR